MTIGALEGLRIVEYGRFVAGPYCAKMLADMGAEVIKVEPPRAGDPARGHGPFPDDIPHLEKSGLFLFLNTNKLGVTLDLKTQTGKDLFLRLLQDTDVLVENYPPPSWEELGLQFPVLQACNPRLIVTSITPYGQTGPYRSYKGYDINCSAAGGMSVGAGEPDKEPLALPLYQSDYQGGLSGAGATVASLLARERTGRGQQVDISISEVMATIHTGNHLLTYIYRGVTGIRAGHHGGMGLYPRTVLPCKDGYVALVAPQLTQWIRFLETMGTPSWTENPRYRNRRAMTEQYPEEVDALLIAWLMQHTKQELFEMCQANHVACTPLNTAQELLQDSHLRERNFFVELDHPEAGPLSYPGGPYQFSRTPWRLMRPAPLLGEHNELVFCQRLGLPKEDLARLFQAGIV